jgi:hypothetical protein
MTASAAFLSVKESWATRHSSPGRTPRRSARDAASSTPGTGLVELGLVDETELGTSSAPRARRPDSQNAI